MIDCSELGEKLYPYLDSAVSRELREDIDSHLGSCENCRARFDLLRRARAAMREEAASFSAPQHLRERISADIRRRRTAVMIRRFATLAAAGAAAVLVLTLALPYAFKPGLEARLEDLGSIYDSYAGGVAKADFLAKDPRMAEDWLKGKNFAVTLPPAQDVGFDLVGVSLRTVAERLSAVALFEGKENKKKLVYIGFKDKKLRLDFPRREAVNGKYLYGASYGPYSFAFWRDGEIVNIFLAQEEQEKLLENTRRCIKLMAS